MVPLVIRIEDLQTGAVSKSAFIKSPVRIGRSELNDLPLTQGFVSQWHAVVRFDEEDVHYVDLGSTNGSIVNGARIERNVPTPIKGETEVRIGALKLTFSRRATGEHKAPPRTIFAMRAATAFRTAAGTPAPTAGRPGTPAPSAAAAARPGTPAPSAAAGSPVARAGTPAPSAAGGVPVARGATPAPSAGTGSTTPDASAAGKMAADGPPLAPPAVAAPPVAEAPAAMPWTTLESPAVRPPAPPAEARPPSAVPAPPPAPAAPLHATPALDFPPASWPPSAPAPAEARRAAIPPAAPAAPAAPRPAPQAPALDLPTMFRKAVGPPAAPAAPVPPAAQAAPAAPVLDLPTSFRPAVAPPAQASPPAAPAPPPPAGRLDLPTEFRPAVAASPAAPPPAPAAPAQGAHAWPAPAAQAPGRAAPATPAAPSRAAGAPAGASDLDRLFSTFAESYLPATVQIRSFDEAQAFLGKLAEALESFARSFVEMRKGYEEFGKQMGIRTVHGDSPVVRARDPRQLIATLLDPRQEGRAGEVQGSFADYMVHQVALLNGIVEGAKAILARLDPADIEAGGPKTMWPMKGQALWKTFEERFHELFDEDSAIHDALFGREFRRAYTAIIGSKGAVDRDDEDEEEEEEEDEDEEENEDEEDDDRDGDRKGSQRGRPRPGRRR